MPTPWEVDDSTTAASKRSSTPWEVEDSPTEVAPKPSRKQQFLAAASLPGLAKTIYGLAETGTEALTGTLGQAAGGLHGLARLATGQGLDKAVEASRGTAEALTYAPRSTAGRDISAAVGFLPEKANEALGVAGEAVAGAGGRAIGENIIPVVGTLAGGRAALGKARALAEAPPKPAPLPPAEMIEFARHNAGKMEALDLAKQYGISVDPASVNPTKLNRAMSGLAGRANVNAAMAEANQAKWGAALKRDMGIADHAQLDSSTLEAVRSAAAAPMQEIRGLSQMVADPNILAGLEALRPEPTIGGRTAAVQANRLIDEAVSSMQDGMTGDAAMNNIQSLRKRARDIYKMNDAGPGRLATADISMKIANQLEGMVEGNLQRLGTLDPYANYDTLLQRYREGRTRMAKSYALEDAMDFNTKQVDPMKIAKMTSQDNALTGAFSDIGRIAGNFPEAVKAHTPDGHAGLSHRFLRSTTGGMLGAGIGGAVGGAPGAMMGTALGTTAGEGIAAALAKALTSERGQARATAPVSRELWQPGLDNLVVDALRSSPKVERFTPESTALVPAGANAAPRGPVGNAPMPYNAPNWQYYQSGEAPGPAAPMLESIDPGRIYEQQRSGFRAEDARAQAADRAAQIAAEQEQLAAELRNRRPASGGVELWQAPAQGGTIPGKSALDRAVEKLASGRAFDLTSEERIAWNKAKGDIYAP